MTIKVTTDWHIAAKRSGGTTPQSQIELRNDLRLRLKNQLDNNDHLIAGDLFNDFTVDTSELVDTYSIFSNWLAQAGKKIYLLRGNHDFHMSGHKASSFDLLGHVLSSQFPTQVVIADKGLEKLTDTLWAISHMPNQDLFKLEVDRACEMGGEGMILVLHCNVKNSFAENSDNSLNLTDDMLGNLMHAGWKLLIGHEHQQTVLRGGRCVVLGNAAPSSVADCIGNSEKFAAYIDGAEIRMEAIWSASESYAEMDWRDLSDSKAQFIRVTGDASASEAADVISAIAKYRQRSGAFVVSNSVKIDGMAALEEMNSDAVGEIRAFDVLGAIYEHLDEREVETVKGLLG